MEPFWIGVCLGAGALLVFQVVTAWIFVWWFIPDEKPEPVFNPWELPRGWPSNYPIPDDVVRPNPERSSQP